MRQPVGIPERRSYHDGVGSNGDWCGHVDAEALTARCLLGEHLIEDGSDVGRRCPQRSATVAGMKLAITNRIVDPALDTRRTAQMPVTAIKGVINQTQYSVQVKDHEEPTKLGHYIELSPREGKPCDMWVPWCTSPNDFLGAHYITVQFSSSMKVWIWQRDGKVIYALKESFSSPTNPVGGTAQEGGNRVVVLTTSSVPEFYPIW
jgi:hypothetical protein